MIVPWPHRMTDPSRSNRKWLFFHPEIPLVKVRDCQNSNVAFTHTIKIRMQYHKAEIILCWFFCYSGDCPCKDEVELEEAIALAKAMALSDEQPSLPMVPGLSSRLEEETITIHVQPDQIVCAQTFPLLPVGIPFFR